MSAQCVTDVPHSAQKARWVELPESPTESKTFVLHATAGTQAFEQALKLFPAGSTQFQAALAGLTAQYLALARAQAEARIAQQTAANDNRITLIQAEAATLGMSNEARTVLLARLRAEQDLKQQAIPIEGALGQAYLASVDALTGETLAFDRQKAALDDITNSFTVNDEDLFTFGALSATPDAIYTVAVKGNIRREAGGSPTLDFRTKSGGTTSSGGTTGIGPGATYEWRDSFFPTDPNTGVAWTASSLNAATSGMKIAS